MSLLYPTIDMNISSKLNVMFMNAAMFGCSVRRPAPIQCSRLQYRQIHPYMQQDFALLTLVIDEQERVDVKKNSQQQINRLLVRDVGYSNIISQGLNSKYISFSIKNIYYVE